MNYSTKDTESIRRFTMRNVKKYAIPILLVAILMTLPAYAGVKKIAQTGMKWLSIPIGARASALGSAYTAVANDASSVFWNPAGIAFIEGRHVFFNQTSWIADLTINAAGVAMAAGNLGVFSLDAAWIDYGTLHGTVRSTNTAGFEETGDFSPEGMAVGLGYGLRVSNSFALGAHVKYLHEKLGSNLEGTMDDPRTYTAESNIIGFDLGTSYYTGFKDLRFGMSLLNFSQELKYRAEQVPLPLTFKFGIAMDVTTLFMDNADHGFTISADALHPRDYTERLHFGGEYSFKNLIFLRGGYKTNYDEEDISFGGGLNLNVSGMALKLDYAYLRFEHFDAVHMFTFDFQF